MEKNVILVCKSIWYHSHNDEAALFEWVKKNPCIVNFKNVHDELHLYIKSKRISNANLTDLLALFYRYRIKNMKQLAIFLNVKNKDWFFEDKKTYWHKQIFGK